MAGVVLKEIRVSFRQFFTWKHPLLSFFRTGIVVFSSLNRIVLGRSVKYSYAYTGEDRLLESIYKPLVSYNGYYVDVGSNHPVFASNTYNFYRKGWKGICIDPNPDLIKKYGYYRPRDIAVCALISDTEEERPFYIVQNNVLSTTEEANLKDPDINGLHVEKVTVKPRTLTSVLDEFQAPEMIDILSVDAEDHDFNVLKSLDFRRYSPRLIIVEDESFDIRNPENNNINKFLSRNGYLLIGFILKNLYFRKR